MEPITFSCPRCSEESRERFYGPCSSCRAQLRAEQVNEKKEIDDVQYEPKMNVVPNQIATKE